MIKDELLKFLASFSYTWILSQSFTEIFQKYYSFNIMVFFNYIPLKKIYELLNLNVLFEPTSFISSGKYYLCGF